MQPLLRLLWILDYLSWQRKPKTAMEVHKAMQNRLLQDMIPSARTVRRDLITLVDGGLLLEMQRFGPGDVGVARNRLVYQLQIKGIRLSQLIEREED